MNTLSSLWSAEAPSRLLASRHRETGEIVFPPVSAESPLADQYEAMALADEGTVYSFTVIHPSPKSGQTPFALAYLDLSGPARLFGRVGGGRFPVIGDACRIVPDATYGYVFELREERQ